VSVLAVLDPVLYAVGGIVGWEVSRRLGQRWRRRKMRRDPDRWVESVSLAEDRVRLERRRLERAYPQARRSTWTTPFGQWDDVYAKKIEGSENR
jgi:hypothetical protein